MTEAEVRRRIRSALLDKRGPDLILSLIEELVQLNTRTEQALRQIQALKSFEMFRDHLIVVEAAKAADPRPASLKLDAAQLLNPGDGFHGLEYSESGIPYRWTGPGREFSFNVYVSRRQPVEVTLQATKLIQPELQSELLLIADGEPMNLKFDKEKEKWVARTTLPEREGLSATHLTFVLGSVGSPPGGTDTRLLGIAFHEIEFHPAADIDDAPAVARPVAIGADAASSDGPGLAIAPEAAPLRRGRAASTSRAPIAASVD
jgi:hypothetical protein